MDDITGEIGDAAFRLHTDLGSGLLESVYELGFREGILRIVHERSPSASPRLRANLFPDSNAWV